jgi:hypothetical protein
VVIIPDTTSHPVASSSDRLSVVYPVHAPPYSAAYERDPDCPCCSAGVRLEVGADATLQQVNTT